MYWKEFTPKTWICLKEGYSWKDFLHDLLAGISVGVIALPLALAFAIASGVPPERGLFTAIIAGFLISLLGGSRVQIGGPTGAFVIIVYGVVQRHGYEGLVLATLIAGVLMVIMGLARLGVLLKFIPYPVTSGFTTGIALTIVFSQIKDFFGLQIEKMPPDFLDKCTLLCLNASSWNPWAFVLASATLAAIFLFRSLNPKIPGAILAVTATTLAAQYFNLPVITIEDAFGAIPSDLPSPSLPPFSFELFQAVFPDAITIALLGSIESLLSAVVADGMTGHRHRSNCELFAQGIANIGSVLFGGIPATGAIARTTANIRLGAKTPIAGMLHAVTLLLLMAFLAPLAGKIPLAALAAVLVYVAWNMSELPHFIEILRGQLGDAIVLLITFLLTVVIDLSVAVQVGVLLAAVIFLKRMSDKTSIEACKLIVKEDQYEKNILENDSLLLRTDIPKDVVVFEIRGPFFYGVADLLEEALIRLEFKPRVFMLRLDKTPIIDATGMKALKKFHLKCQQQGIRFILCDVDEHMRELLSDASAYSQIGEQNIFPNFEAGLYAARSNDRS